MEHETSLAYLEFDGNDIKCPHCKTLFGVRWNTEYGDADVGDHTLKCLTCDKPILFSVRIQYTVL